MADVLTMKPKPREQLRCPGAGRDEENPNALVFYFSRPVSDDEMRFLHDVMQRAALLNTVRNGPYPFSEEACPGHVASAGDSKVCGRCGTHIDSLRP